MKSFAAPFLFILALLTVSEAQAYTFLQRAGCPGDMGAAWPDRLLPSTWHLHAEGYSRLPGAELLESLKRSVDVWGEAWGDPCCSGFRNAYAGTTDRTGLDDSPQNVVSFEETSWPRWLGSHYSVIAVTLPGIERENCELTSADMVFNGVGFQFRTDGILNNGWEVDFESIAVHEFGHWIGLDHSRNPGTRSGYENLSVMFPSYRGGTADRNLYLDDKLAACALYPASCGSCMADRDCPEGMRCEAGGGCVRASCGVNADCGPGSVCVDGTCWRGCKTHLECGDGQECRNGACSDKAPCTICRTCRRDSSCGEGADYRCAVLDESGMGKCTKFCFSDLDCDGDTRCWDVDGAGTKICGAPTGGTLCPSSFVCAQEACSALGQACPGADGCGGDSDTCVYNEDGPVCSCTCRADSDCGPDARCLTNPFTGHPSCYRNEDLGLSCGGVLCPFGSVCKGGACAAICGKKTCEPGEVCENGACVDPCPACLPGEVCDEPSRTCRPDESCEGVTCPSGETCVEGACVPRCGDNVCGKGTTCKAGKCEPPAEKDDGWCSTTGGEAGLLGFVLSLGLLQLRRRR